jgi:hypothetical protein
MRAARQAKKASQTAHAHYEVGHQIPCLGRFQDAPLYFEDVLRLDNSFAVAYDSLDDARECDGGRESALENHQRVKNLDSGPSVLPAMLSKAFPDCSVICKRWPRRKIQRCTLRP